MNFKRVSKSWIIGLVLILAVLALAGCGSSVAASAASSNIYTSKVLVTSYQGALSASNQLMTGTLRLEGTDQAVTVEQAKALLPLWQAIQGGTLKVEAEQNAVYAQIEAQMTPAQLQAIAAMRLTQADLGQGAQASTVSDNQRASMRATAQADGLPSDAVSGTGAGPSQGNLLNSLIRLLTQRASDGTAPAAVAQAPTVAATPEPTATPSPAPTLAVTQTVTQTTASVNVPTQAAASRPAQAAATISVTTQTSATAAEASLPGLTRLEDTDPAPPLTILVNSIRIEQDGTYKLTGVVRNDGSETYGGVSVIATFYSVQDLPSGETRIPHGPYDVSCPYLLLEPGQECPFSLEVYNRDYVAYHLHAEGRPAGYRQPADLTLSGVSVVNDGVGYVRITGTATNQNSFAVENATIAGTLYDASGQIVSIGSTTNPGQIAAGASVTFDLRIKYAAYARYQLYAQATQS